MEFADSSDVWEIEMENGNDPIARDDAVETIAGTFLKQLGSDFRWELAFPELTEDMVERLRAYGEEESFPAGELLYSYGDRKIPMFVVIEGEVDIYLSSSQGDAKIYTRHRKRNFTGEFNLLNSQGAVVEAKTVVPSTLLRISRAQLQRLMRAEGDIANVIVAACIWRRIGIVQAASSGVTLRGTAGDDQMLFFQRFFVRNNYPHRIVNISPEDADKNAGRLPAVVLSDGRVLA